MKVQRVLLAVALGAFLTSLYFHFSRSHPARLVIQTQTASTTSGTIILAVKTPATDRDVMVLAVKSEGDGVASVEGMKTPWAKAKWIRGDLASADVWIANHAQGTGPVTVTLSGRNGSAELYELDPDWRKHGTIN